MTVSVPGNVLLLGEYAVLEEGGLGAAAAVELRTRLEISPAEDPCAELSIEGTWTGGSLAWTPSSRSSSPLVSAIVETVEEWRQSHGPERSTEGGCPPLAGQRIRIDSSALYGAGGRKAGYGSSAAVTVALVSALLEGAGAASGAGLGDRVIPTLALSAHRRSQGGQGSGYDVFCSFFGGLGLFRGGALPSWERRALGWEPRLFLFPGPGPVSTRQAILSYRSWKSGNPGAAFRFMERSNNAVRSFLASSSAGEATAALREGRDLGVELGDAIGVSARIPVPAGLDPDLCKSLGAGNELGVYLCIPGAPEPLQGVGAVRLSIARRGVEWLP